MQTYMPQTYQRFRLRKILPQGTPPWIGSAAPPRGDEIALRLVGRRVFLGRVAEPPRNLQARRPTPQKIQNPERRVETKHSRSTRQSQMRGVNPPMKRARHPHCSLGGAALRDGEPVIEPARPCWDRRPLLPRRTGSGRRRECTGRSSRRGRRDQTDSRPSS